MPRCIRSSSILIRPPQHFSLSASFHLHFGGLILARYGTERNSQAVPGIDAGNGQSQIGYFFLAEVLANFVVHCVGGMAISDASHGFTPSDGGALAAGVVRRLLPGIETVKTLLGFSIGARVFPM